MAVYKCLIETWRCHQNVLSILTKPRPMNVFKSTIDTWRLPPKYTLTRIIHYKSIKLLKNSVKINTTTTTTTTTTALGTTNTP